MIDATRRELLVGVTAAVGMMAAPAVAQPAAPKPRRAPPIGVLERLARIARAQALMRAGGIGAIIVEPGASLIYFTGVRWGRSERLTALLLPAAGEPCMITPAFEESRTRELLTVPGEVRVWEEDESPFALIAGWLREHKLADRPVGIEETARYFIVDGLARAAPGVRTVSGAGVVNGCRIVKSPAEIALMQSATDITIAAYAQIGRKIARGMSNADIAELMGATQHALGADSVSGGAQIGEGSAYPHGSKRPEMVDEGRVVLMDFACTVDGYWSDVSRTMVFGDPTPAQRRVWADVHAGQQAAFAAARIGAPAGSIDDAVRALYERRGYGPRYQLPGLSHRTGHGIGLDIHEPINLVHGEMTPLAAGMCFSNEPGIYTPGAFGVRLEDCIYMTAAGPRWFSQPSPSIDRPFG